MRITNNIIRENAFTNMRRGLEKLSESQQRVSTGLRVQMASDDPGATSTILRARSSIRALEGYRSAIETANVRGGVEESALSELTDVLIRAKELGVSQGTATADDSTREQVRIEVEHLLRHAVALGNTYFDGYYIFGGAQGDTRPFDLDETGASLGFTTTDPAGTHEVEIANGQLMITNRSGSEIFGDDASGVFDSLRSLAAGLEDNDPAAINVAIEKIDISIRYTQGNLADTGARLNQLEITKGNLDAMEVNLLTLKSGMEEVDIEHAVTEMMSRQTAYQAAMLATSKVMGLTLTDYLR